MSKEIQVFTTHDVDLAAFLMIEGLKYIESILDPTSPPDKPRVILRFFDEKGVARDLERAFVNSKEKRYRDCHRYLLKDIHRTLKRSKNG